MGSTSYELVFDHKAIQPMEINLGRVRMGKQNELVVEPYWLSMLDDLTDLDQSGTVFVEYVDFFFGPVFILLVIVGGSGMRMECEKSWSKRLRKFKLPYFKTTLFRFTWWVSLLRVQGYIDRGYKTWELKPGGFGPYKLRLGGLTQPQKLAHGVRDASHLYTLDRPSP
ncbi:hypothetical protein PIB30_015069 [Stylosanthes scabra]|uniref:Uncharacterized protein n=1 Tax=Stylosanthes scabra TaxID=79078 RepID=A0ABU6Q6R8_9FABA|nr:hypothetical protein [Stylosanthes scabra]